MFWIITILIIVLLIAINGFYVMAEFASVSARPSRLSTKAKDGNRTAARLLEIIEDPGKLDTYIATCQVGITISSLGLGFYGQAQLAGVLAPQLERFGVASGVLAQSVSATTVLVGLSIFQVLLGELVPKNISIMYPERFALLTARVMQWSIAVFRPLIWLFNGSGIILMKVLRMNGGSEHMHVHAPNEIAMLFDESRKGGILQREEYRLLRNTLRLRNSKIGEVMIPKNELLSMPSTISRDEILALLAESQYSRALIYADTIEKIIGAVHIKEILGFEGDDIEEIIRPVLYVHESTEVKKVFSSLQRSPFQLAIVVDEFGKTLGMVTMEDLVEEIFGEIEDEFDLTQRNIENPTKDMN